MTASKEKQATGLSSRTGIDPNAIVRRVSLITIVGNIILSALKLSAGIAGRSGAMVSDAAHSLSDVLTTLIAAFGVRLSQKEADREHPYGHERIECVASLLLGALLIATGLGVGKAGIAGMIAGSRGSLAAPSAIALAAAVLSILSKEAMYWYTRHYAKILNSPAFMADAWHHRSDALSSVGSLIGIGGAMLGFPFMDPMAGAIICLSILKVSYDVLKDAIVKMLDTACAEDYEKALADYIAAQEDVIQIDMLRSRIFGNKAYIDLSIQVDGDLPLWKAHAIARRIHDNVERRFSDIKHVTVYLSPAAERPQHTPC